MNTMSVMLDVLKMLSVCSVLGHSPMDGAPVFEYTPPESLVATFDHGYVVLRCKRCGLVYWEQKYK